MAKDTSAALILGLRPKGGGDDDAGDEPESDDYEVHTSAAEDFLDAVKAGNRRDVKDSFKKLFEACLNDAETKGMIKRIAQEADAEPHEEGSHTSEEA